MMPALSSDIVFKILDAAERDLSVNDGALPQEEVDQCLEGIQVLREVTKQLHAIAEAAPIPGEEV